MDESLKKELKQLEKRKQKARQANDLAEEAKLCNVAGELLAENRLFEQAIEEHKLELRLSESINKPIDVAIAHRKLGECLCECEDFKQAVFHQQKYLELSRKSHDLVEEQRALATIGRTWFQSAVSSSELLKAQSAFLDSLSICDKLRDCVKEKELLEMRARLYLNLGLVHNNLKNERKGIKYIEKALTIALNQDLKDTEYRCHISLGDVKLSENCPADALQYFERARKVAQHQKKRFDETDTLLQMGQVLLRLGDFNGAKNILKKCFKTMKHGKLVNELRSSLIKAIKGTHLLEKLQGSNLDTKDESLMKTFEDLGDLYSTVKCYSKAADYYLKQFKMSEKLNKTSQEKAVICVSIAASFSDNKQYEKSKEYFYKELGLREGEALEQCDTWCNIAEVVELAGDSFEEIKKAYNNALRCAEKCQNPNRKFHVIKLLTELGKKYNEELGDELSELEECKIEEDSEMSEEQSQVVDDDDDDDDEEGDRLIQDEMEFSDSDEGEQEENSTGRSKRTSKKSINRRNEKGETVLHVAAIKGDYNLAKTSLEKGVSIHSRDYCGWQPLHEACNHGNVKIVELLLDKGADVNDPGGPHCRGMTPLHDAVQNAHVDVVKLLIARGASVAQRNKDGDTALDLVLHSIAEDDDDDDPDELDPELSQVRDKIARILRNATTSVKRRHAKVSELRRRDKPQLSDESDVESSTSENPFRNSQVSRKTDEISRKRKSALLELDSDEDMSDMTGSKRSKNHDQSKAKVAKVSKKYEGELNDENQDEYDGIMVDSEADERGTWKDNSENSEVSLDSICGGESTVNNVSSLPWQSQLDSSDPLGRPHFTARPGQNTLTSTTNRTNTHNSAISRTSSTTAYLDPITGSRQEESQVSESAALIRESEYLEMTASDGWLIDDVPKTTSKRKRSGNVLSMLKSSDSPRICNTSDSSGALHNTSTQRRVGQASSQRRHNINSSGKKSRLKQSRLSNHVVSGRSSPNELWDNTPSEPASIRAPLASSVATIPDASAPMRLRVKVNEKTFLIPCPSVPGERKTVQWLAEQATVRYYSASGLKPVLSLSTTEGASLSSDDLITDVLSNNEQVIGSVETWDLPPIAERYKAACMNVNTAAQKEILAVLQSNPNLSNVQFSDMALTAVKLRPLFCALQCHEQLVKLALPGNRMGDDGLQHFVSSLPCMCNLVVLILTCNGITNKGLRDVASKITQDDKVSKVWSNIKELDMSFNAITDVGTSSLAIMLRACPGLQILNIESCGLGQNTFHQRSTVMEAIFGLTRLNHLNVSHNQIEGDGLPSLLNALSRSSVKSLDISSTVLRHDPAFAIALADYFNQDNCSVQNLYCRGCYLRDKDISIMARTKNIFTFICKLDFSQNDFGDEGVLHLVESIQRDANLKHLNISGNVKVTNDSLLKLLAQSSRQLQFLDLSSCGLNSPIPISFGKQQTRFSRHLKFLKISNNSLKEQDLETLSSLWNSIWRQKGCVCTSKSFVVFSVLE